MFLLCLHDVLPVCTWVQQLHNHKSQERALAPFHLEFGMTVSWELNLDPLQQVHLTTEPSPKWQLFIPTCLGTKHHGVHCHGSDDSQTHTNL